MRLKNYINELSFKNTATIRIIKDDKKFFTTNWEIKVDGYWTTYEFEAEMFAGWTVGDSYEPDDWSIEFNNIKGPRSNDPFQVFAAVGESLRLFIKRKKPEKFTFWAVSPKLDKVYKKFIKVIKSQTGYKYHFDPKQDEHIFTK